MYDRYTITAPKRTIESVFGTIVPAGYVPNHNAHPTQRLPVITLQDPRAVAFYYWGLMSKWSNNKKISPRLFNLPAQDIFEKSIYKRALKTNRCVILADGFYVWKQVSKKQKVPYFFYFSNRMPFGIAGIWEEYEDFEENTSCSFMMITSKANEALEKYQEDMPALLSVPEAKKWLDQSQEEESLKDLINRLNPKGMGCHAVSPLINDLSINDEKLTQPAVPSDQFGNYTLFP